MCVQSPVEAIARILASSAKKNPSRWKRAPQLGALLKNRGQRGPTNNKMRSQLPTPWLGDGELAPGDFT